MGLSTDDYKKGLVKKESILISSLSRDDKFIFTTNDAKVIIGDN